MRTRLRCLLIGIGWLLCIALTPAAAKPLIGLSVNVRAGGQRFEAHTLVWSRRP